jgi:hypothetical protein
VEIAVHHHVRPHGSPAEKSAPSATRRLCTSHGNRSASPAAFSSASVNAAIR